MKNPCKACPVVNGGHNEPIPDTPTLNTFPDDKVLALVQAAKGAEWSEIAAASAAYAAIKLDLVALAHKAMEVK